MQKREPVTETIKASEARARWGELLNRVFRREARVIVEKSGIPVAAVVSAADLARLQELELERERRFAILDEIGDAFKDVPPEDLEREVAKAVAEARAELHAERRQGAQRS